MNGEKNGGKEIKKGRKEAWKKNRRDEEGVKEISSSSRKKMKGRMK